MLPEDGSHLKCYATGLTEVDPRFIRGAYCLHQQGGDDGSSTQL